MTLLEEQHVKQRYFWVAAVLSYAAAVFLHDMSYCQIHSRTAGLYKDSFMLKKLKLI